MYRGKTTTQERTFIALCLSQPAASGNEFEHLVLCSGGVSEAWNVGPDEPGYESVLHTVIIGVVKATDGSPDSVLLIK
ncbi:hypothetical protein Tco_0695946 [Tanacetum coccineum]